MKKFSFLLIILMLAFSLFSVNTILVFAEGEETCEHVYDDCMDADCNVCGETRDVPGHVFTTWVSNGDATCEADGTERAKCDFCDEESTRTSPDSKLPHSYGEWIVVTEPTDDTDGVKKQVCTNCGYENSEVFSKPIDDGEGEKQPAPEGEGELSENEELGGLFDELWAILIELKDDFVELVDDLIVFIESDETYSNIATIVLAVLAVIFIPFLIALLVIGYILIAIILIIVTAVMWVLEWALGAIMGLL